MKNFCQDVIDIKQSINNQLLGNDSQTNIFQAINKTKQQIKEFIEDSGLQMTEQLQVSLEMLNYKNDELKLALENINQKVGAMNR